MLRARLVLPTLLAATILAGCPFNSSGTIEGSGGAASSSSSSASSGSSSSSSGSSSSSSSSSGTPVCGPDDTMACYTGPTGTEDVGECKGGQQKCKADGSGYDACTGDVPPAVEDCVDKKDADCDGVVTACSGDGVWADVPGGVAEDSVYGVAVDSQGNVIVTGSFKIALTFGGGKSITGSGDSSVDVFVAKYDPGGALLWARAFGGNSDDIGRGVAVDSQDNIFIAGEFATSMDFGNAAMLTSAGGADVFVAKLAPDGTPTWAKGFGSAQDQRAAGVAVDSGGDVIIVGSFYGSINFGGAALQPPGGDKDGFVAKLGGSSGAHMWSHAVTDAPGFGSQQMSAVAVDSAKNVIAIGDGPGNITFDGGAAITGSISDNVLVAKYAPNGTLTWAQISTGANLVLAARGVATDAAGDIYVTGAFDGNLTLAGAGTISAIGGLDAYLIKLDAMGTGKWSKGFGKSGKKDTGNGVAVDQFGNVVLVGSFEGTLDPGAGAPLTAQNGAEGFALKINRNGVPVWAQMESGSGSNDSTQAVAVTRSTMAGAVAGAPVIGGRLEGNTTLAGTPFTNHGGTDGFVMKMKP